MVLSRQGPLAQVQVQPPARCAACTCASTGQGSSPTAPRVLSVCNAVDAQVGQHVRLEESQRAMAVAPLVLFAIPLAGLILGALVLHGLAPLAHEDINVLIGAALGLIAGITLARRIATNRYSALDVLPTAVQVLTQDHAAPAAQQGLQNKPTKLV